MPNDKIDFSEILKVDLDKINPPKILSSSRDVYTCLKLMGDTAKVQSFLLAASQQEVDGKKISMDKSMNYFYAINAQLGNAECDFRKGKIGDNEFNNRMNEACESQHLNFDYLMEITEKIGLLEKQPNRDASIKLAQEIEKSIIEEREKRMNVEREKVEE